MSLSIIQSEIDRALALSMEHLKVYRALQQRRLKERNGQKFRTSLQMEAAHQAWCEEHAKHAELHRAYRELLSYDE